MTAPDDEKGQRVMVLVVIVIFASLGLILGLATDVFNLSDPLFWNGVMILTTAITALFYEFARRFDVPSGNSGAIAPTISTQEMDR